MENKVYDIFELADWMSRPDSEVSLPAMQRGFVWRTAQIEDLWDSILRGFPIGSLLLARTAQGSLSLLDGQQRATSIALALFNPWTAPEDLRIGNVRHLPVVWFDIAPPEVAHMHRFAVRVVTRSHPWGYQLRRNTERLSLADRRQADALFKRLWGQPLYTKLNPCQRIPYDAGVPVPMAFLLEPMRDDRGIDYSTWREALLAQCRDRLHEAIAPKHLTGASYFEQLAACDLRPCYDALHQHALTLRIPAIEIDDTLLRHDDAPAAPEQQNPTLFVRLNSAGTQLNGDELIYSIYKSVCPEAKEVVDGIGSSVIAPARIVVLISRLILSELSGQYVQSLSIVQFQRAVRDVDFIKELRSCTQPAGEGRCLLRELFDRVVRILRDGDEEQDDRVPDVVVKQFIRSAPNGVLLLLHWLRRHPGFDPDSDPVVSHRICARLYRLCWFGDINHFVSSVWNEADAADDFGFPPRPDEYPLIRPEWLQTFFEARIETPEETFALFTDREEPVAQQIFDFWQTQRGAFWPDTEACRREIDSRWMQFVYGLLGNRTLILLAQRRFINRTFRDFNQLEDLDDTETPWDWDHIYPSSWVAGKWYIDDRTRRWNGRIGNFRAMTLTDNRSEQAPSPRSRLRPDGAGADVLAALDANYFIHENDRRYWEQLTERVKTGDGEGIRNHARAIITRTVNIYRDFYERFGEEESSRV